MYVLPHAFVEEVEATCIVVGELGATADGCDGQEVLKATLDDICGNRAEEMVDGDDRQLSERRLRLLGLADVQGLLKIFVDQGHADGDLDFPIDVLLLSHERVAPQIASKHLG